MSKDQEPKVTRAEQRARAYAKQLEEAGFEVKITVTEHEGRNYSDGEVMFPGAVTASVHANGPRFLDDSYGFSFRSWLPAKGHRASTKFSFGNVYRIGTDPAILKITERELASRISTEQLIAGMRAERAAGAAPAAEGEQRQAQ